MAKINKKIAIAVGVGAGIVALASYVVNVAAERIVYGSKDKLIEEYFDRKRMLEKVKSLRDEQEVGSNFYKELDESVKEWEKLVEHHTKLLKKYHKVDATQLKEKEA